MSVYGKSFKSVISKHVANRTKNNSSIARRRSLLRVSETFKGGWGYKTSAISEGTQSTRTNVSGIRTNKHCFMRTETQYGRKLCDIDVPLELFIAT